MTGWRETNRITKAVVVFGALMLAYLALVWVALYLLGEP